MTTAASTINTTAAPLTRLFPAILIGAGWLALYGPLYLEFSGGAWAREENAHAPFIMAICIGVAWARLTSFEARNLFAPEPIRPTEFYLGVAVLLAGLCVYYVGRRSGIELFASASQSLVAAAIVMCLFGVVGLYRLWFPLALSLYLIIWPGWVLDALTAPLKRFVSVAVSDGLYALGLPVANAGAVISAGSYELLIADACAGLNSLIALTAVGAVYLYAVKRRSLKTNIAVILSLIPLAIIANIIRVAILVLLTYHFGYEAGQSFLHDGAGLLMFAVALLGVFVVDSIAARIWGPRS